MPAPACRAGPRLEEGATAEWCIGGGRAEYEAHVSLWPLIRNGLPRPTWGELTDFERASWSRPVRRPLIAWPDGYARAALSRAAPTLPADTSGHRHD